MKLAIILLGMLAVAAALDAETQYSKKKNEYEERPEYKEGYAPSYDPHHHANLHASHKHWTLHETTIKTHPCDPIYEILGSTVASSGELSNDEGKDVGKVYWSGIVTAQEECAHCKEYKPVTHHIVKINYEIIFEFTAMHEGQLITKAVADSIFGDTTTHLAVLGGTGAYEGAWGTVTWTYVGKDKSMYEFNVFLPKVYDGEEYKGGEHHYKDSEEYSYKY